VKISQISRQYNGVPWKAVISLTLKPNLKLGSAKCIVKLNLAPLEMENRLEKGETGKNGKVGLPYYCRMEGKGMEVSGEIHIW
jgi:hypothetical protein